jgi:hypothetical protein
MYHELRKRGTSHDRDSISLDHGLVGVKLFGAGAPSGAGGCGNISDLLAWLGAGLVA